MNTLDWLVVAVYLSGLVGMALFLGRRQKDERDYYLGGNAISHWAIAVSTMATQCSTNSLLGAPAFVIAVGGLLWLQYELAVPLAMIAVMIFLLPFFRKLNIVSVYEYLEQRFGIGTRTLLSVLFQVMRAFGTGVTVYGISIVLQQIIGIPFWAAVTLLGIITVVYDFFGGMKAVIYSDVIQTIILYAGVAVCLVYSIELVGGWSEVVTLFPAEKKAALDFRSHGLGDGETFAFWPMVIGGFFLYMSYYGCDQSQVQRELCTRNVDDTNMSLFLNGVLRFPLVVTYCLVGVGIGAYIVKNPSFKELLFDPASGEYNYNLAVPVFCLNELPHGVIGLVIVALFAAAMSSLDSTINSLSATTIRDIVERFVVKGPLNMRYQLICSRLMTLFWGMVCVAFSFFVGGIAASIIESINKIGSVAYGPILAAFLLGILTKRANDKGTFIGILAGFLLNIHLWLFLPSVSWLWWNAIGCLATFGTGYAASLVFPDDTRGPPPPDLTYQMDSRRQFGYKRNWPRYYVVLIFSFFLMILALRVMEVII